MAVYARQDAVFPKKVGLFPGKSRKKQKILPGIRLRRPVKKSDKGGEGINSCKTKHIKKIKKGRGKMKVRKYVIFLVSFQHSILRIFKK